MDLVSHTYLARHVVNEALRLCEGQRHFVHIDEGRSLNHLSLPRLHVLLEALEQRGLARVVQPD